MNSGCKRALDVMCASVPAFEKIQDVAPALALSSLLADTINGSSQDKDTRSSIDYTSRELWKGCLEGDTLLSSVALRQFFAEEPPRRPVLHALGVRSLHANLRGASKSSQQLWSDF